MKSLSLQRVAEVHTAADTLDLRFDKAVIITDGYASMAEENHEELEKRNVRTLTVLFGGRTDCGEQEPFGDVVQMDGIVACRKLTFILEVKKVCKLLGKGGSLF